MMKTRLFVSHLPTSVIHVELRTLFSQYGKIVDLYIPAAHKTHLGKGIAFVEFANEAQSQKAINALQGKIYKKKALSVAFAKDRTSEVKQKVYPKQKSNRKFIDPNLFVKKAVLETKIPYTPTHAFSGFSIEPSLKKNITNKGYISPTPIQDQVIEYILQGKDVVGIANTGTGKTGGFLIPIIDILCKNRSKQALIVVPTRELAVQIQEEFIGFADGLPIRSAICIGGANISRQIEKLKRRPQVVIGTPGRLKDLVNQRKLFLEQYSIVVLDEVDRMLDMGFIVDISFLVGKLPKKRQSLFFSATIPTEIEKIMNQFLTDPITVSVKEGNTNKNIEQTIVRITDRTKKLDILHDILMKKEVTKVLIFGRTKRGVEKIALSLQKRGMNTVSIHGDKTQNKRQKALQDFKQNKVNILVATDVAARGLDIPNVTHVINYDAPEHYDEYIHRIGRTGRANKTGISITFVE